MVPWHRLCKAALAAAFVLAVPRMGLCDAGRVIFQSSSGGVRATVLAEPTPLRAGPVEIGVLLQQENPPRILTTGDVRVSFDLTRPIEGSRRWNGMGCVTPGQVVKTSRDHSPNRFLNSALVGFPLPGEWLARVEWMVEGEAGSISFPLHVESADPGGFIAWWPIMALVPLAILVYWRRASIMSARRPASLQHRQSGPSVGVGGNGRNSF